MDVRMYDPAIGRFNGIDPVTHFSQGTSVAFDNNPIYFADPSGANSENGTEKIVSVTSRVDEHNVTHISQVTATSTLVKNEDGSTTRTTTTSRITNKVDANGKVTKGTIVTDRTFTTTISADGNSSKTIVGKAITRKATSEDSISAFGEWTDFISNYNAKNDHIYNVYQIEEGGKRVTDAARAGTLMLSSSPQVKGLMNKVGNWLDPKSELSNWKDVYGLAGGISSFDGGVSLAGEVLTNSIGKNNEYAMVYGVNHYYNGKLMKQMKTPSKPSRNERLTYQGLFEGFKNLFSSKKKKN